MKRVNIYLHALCFFLIDVSTLFLVGGAIYRYLPRFASAGEWSTVKQVHIFGGIILLYKQFFLGIFVLLLIIGQHLGGVMTLFSKVKKNAQHKMFGFWVANLARAIVVFGWLLNGDKTNTLYVSVVCAVLLVASFYNTYLAKKTKKIITNPEDATKGKGKTA